MNIDTIPRPRWTLLLLLAPTFVGCGTADTVDAQPQQTEMAEPHAPAPTTVGSAEPAPLPEGWRVRVDRPELDPSDFRVARDGDGLAIRTGPHGILYQADDHALRGDYAVGATFIELGSPPGHREGYGVFFGGSRLQGPDQAYSYFLVRGDGRYLIKLRFGAEAVDVSDGWMTHDAVRTATDGVATNALWVGVAEGLVRFSINGVEVAMIPEMLLEVRGTAGIRVSHDLNLRVEDWALDR